jgi:uncharacterized membrane protein
MIIQPFSFASLKQALAEGWRIANATRGISIAYAAIFTLAGLLIIGSLLALGLTPFVVAAAGAFMLVGPVILAGFFGIARTHETAVGPAPGAWLPVFRRRAGRLGPGSGLRAVVHDLRDRRGDPLQLTWSASRRSGSPTSGPASANVMKFLSGGLSPGWSSPSCSFGVSAFSVPLLCERRAGLVDAVTASVRIVFAGFVPAMLWAALISTLIIGSILLLPLLPLTLPWLAYASRALYRQVLPVR